MRYLRTISFSTKRERIGVTDMDLKSDKFWGEVTSGTGVTTARFEASGMLFVGFWTALCNRDLLNAVTFYMHSIHLTVSVNILRLRSVQLLMHLHPCWHPLTRTALTWWESQQHWHRVFSMRTWFYVDAQMIQSFDDFFVKLLSNIVSVELRPTWILQYLNE